MIHTWNMYLKRGTYIKCYFWQQTCRKCFQIKNIYIKYALLLPFTILFRKKMFSQKTDDQVQYLYKDVLIIIYYLTFVQILFVVFYIWPLLCMYVYEFFWWHMSTYLKYTWGSFANTISLNRDSFQGCFGLGTRKFAFSIL